MTTTDIAVLLAALAQLITAIAAVMAARRRR
jgi:hypothetical protein